MATRNIVPRATGEGQIGTSAKTWSAVYANDIAVTNGVTAGTFTGDLVGDVTGDVTGNITGDVTGDVTGTASGNLALTGGTMTGAINYNGLNSRVFNINSNDGTNFDVGWNYDNRDGAGLGLRSVDHSEDAGGFGLYARNANTTCTLKGLVNESLTWCGYEIPTKKRTNVTTQYVSNTLFTSSQFSRNFAFIQCGLLFCQINMDSTSGKTVSDITTVGKIKNVNISCDVIEVVPDQGSRTWLVSLYNNGNDVDIRAYIVGTSGSSRVGHMFVVPGSVV